MAYVKTRQLREKFPRLSAEYPKEFRIFFNSDSTLNKLGLDVNQMLKEIHRKRTTKRSKK